MTAIAWAIFIYAVTSDKSVETSPTSVQNLLFGLCTFGMFSMIVLTIKDIFK